MLHIILLILKIIGIALAVLVGLILLIVLLLLFVPFRYKGSAGYPDTRASATLTWLLHLLRVSIDYNESNMIMVVRFFGFKLLSTDPEDIKKKEEKERKKQEKRKAKLKKKREKQRAKRAKEKAKRKAAREKERLKQSKTDGEQKVNAASEAVAEKSGEKPAGNAEGGKTTEKPAGNAEDGKTTEKPDSNAEGGKTTEKPENNTKAGDTARKKVEQKSARETGNIDDLSGDELEEMLDEEFKSGIGEEKKSIVEKLKSIYNKAEGLYNRLMMYKDFEEDFRVRKAVKYIFEKLKLILKREMPKKLKGHVSYGFDNPATTGYVTGLAGIFIGLWDGHFEINPNFEQKELNADVEFKGRVQLIGIVIPALKVWFNKDVKYLRKEAGHLKAGTYKAPAAEPQKEAGDVTDSKTNS